MGEFFRQLSKGTLAFLVIGAGILFIVLSDPPATVCGEQIKAFNNKQVGFLTKGPKEGFREQTRFHQLVDVCIRSNSVGGCYEAFQQIRSTAEQTRSFSLECLSKAGAQSAIKDFFNKSLDLLIRLAWGPLPPESINLKLGWLEPTEVALFCKLKDYYLALYGDQAWAAFREKYLQSLPGAKEIGREEAWKRSLVSIDCGRY